MGVPEHVHNDSHQGAAVLNIRSDNYSNYEEYTGIHFRKYKAGSADWNEQSPKDARYLPLSLPAAYMPGKFDQDLARLFYNMAQFTQHFDSSDVDGNARQFGGGTIASMEISADAGTRSQEYKAAALTVRFAVNGTAAAGSDYTGIGASVTIPAGSPSATVTVAPINDAVVESDETVVVTVSADAAYLVGSPAGATVTITSDDGSPATVRLGAAAYSVDESGSTVTLAVTRAGDGSGGCGVSFATTNGTAIAGGDYTATAGTLNWSNGDAATRTITVPVASDALDEAAETFVATLGSPVSGIVTITDDDPAPTVQFTHAASSGPESMTPAAIGVSLSAASGRPVTVVALPIPGRLPLTVPSGEGGPWEAAGYAHGAAAIEYVLWSRGDTGQAILAKVDTGNNPGALPAGDWASLLLPSGVNGPWRATSYAHVDASEGYVLWTDGDSGQAILGRVVPGELSVTIPAMSWAQLETPPGGDGPWQPVSYAHVDDSEGYVLWACSRTGQAVLC